MEENTSISKFLKASLGNVIEWFDFSLFAFYSVTISVALFPANKNILVSIAELFFVFGVGFVARPIGGVFLGKFGDKYGQYLAVNISVYGMSICSFLIAFIPNYDYIGALSILILVLLRLGQGFCAGGQFSGLLSLVVKTSDNRRSFLANMAYAVSTIGFLFAAVTSYLLVITFPESMASYLWRAAFFVSGILGLIYHFFGVDKEDLEKLHTIKSPKNKPEVFKLKTLFKVQYKALIGVTILSSYSGCMYFFAFTYFYTYLTVNLGIAENAAHYITMVQIFVACVFYPIAGLMADRYGKQRLAIGGMILTLISMVFLVSTLNPWLILVSSLFLVAAQALIMSGVACVSGEVFFDKWRMTGNAISWNIGAAIAGFFPMLSVAIYDAYGKFGLVWLVVAVIIFGLIGHGVIRICKGYHQIT
jgi:MFS transporter, MHS family, proline/betaine transporter